MSLNKLKGAGKEVEAAFFLFKAASLEKSFRRPCRSWCWNRLRRPGGWCWKRALSGIHGATVTSVSTLRSPEDPHVSNLDMMAHWVVARPLLILTVLLGHCVSIKAQEQENGEFAFCFAFGVYGLVWELDGMLSFRKSVKRRPDLKFETGAVGLHLGNSLTPELRCLPWQSGLLPFGKSQNQISLFVWMGNGTSRREECLKRSPEGTFSERRLWGLALSEQGEPAAETGQGGVFPVWTSAASWKVFV